MIGGTGHLHHVIILEKGIGSYSVYIVCVCVWGGGGYFGYWAISEMVSISCTYIDWSGADSYGDRYSVHRQVCQHVSCYCPTRQGLHT